MKQNISDKQLSQLEESQKSILVQWCSDNGYETNLSIGQMIECLQGLNKDWTLNGSSWDEPDICDRLWERLKYYL